MNFQRRKCNNKSDNFYCIYGTHMVKKQERNITEKVKQMYLDYFQIILTKISIGLHIRFARHV